MDSMPLLIVITHFINMFCILVLIRSGLHILADHPLLYWTDHTRRDNYWLKFGKKEMPLDKLWTAHDEVEHIGNWALPGASKNGTHREFGMARQWHFVAGIAWIITGAVYWGYMFTTGAWRRLIPTSWSIVPAAWHDLLTYLSFHRPPVSAFHPYDPLQQLAYAGVAFLLPVLMILTALAMSPALIGRFKGYQKLFGGRRQAARSLHFIGMLLFSIFIIIHVSLVALVYFYRNVQIITFGHTGVNFAAALSVFAAGLLLLLVFNIFITYFSLNHRISVANFLTRITEPVIRSTLGRLIPRATYGRKDISDFFRVNGYPPTTKEYMKLRDHSFEAWRLKVHGLVEHDLSLSLDDIKSMPKKEQITKHICIQGWSAIGEWGGVHMKEILALAKPDKRAKYVVFHSYDEDKDGREFYEALRISDMRHPLTILAYEMNYRPLPIEHGAPLRLRCESKLGYKMAKYLKSIEFVEDFEHIGRGRGGYREDTILTDWEASI